MLSCDDASALLRSTDFEVVLTKGVCGFGIYFTAAADGTAVVDPITPFYRLPDNNQAPGEASGVISPGDRLLAINTTNVDRWRFADVVDELRRTALGDVTLRFRRVGPRERSNAKESEAMPPLEHGIDRDGRVENEHESQTATNPQPKRVRWRLFDWSASASTTPVATDVTAPSTHGDMMNRSAAMEELLVEMETRLQELEDAVERERKCRFLAEKKNILYRNALAALNDENAQLRHALTKETIAHERSQRFQQNLQLSI